MSGRWTPTQHEWASLAHAIREGAERGRDCWGVRTSEGEFVYGMGVFDMDRDLPRLEALRPCRWAIANTRAEPTTEHVAHKGPDDVQPFHADGWTVAHNGTIANDAELRDRLSIVTKTRIDSAVLAPALARLSPPLTVREVLENVVVGSFAIAAGHGDDLTLGVNYRPMYLAQLGRAVLFASAPEQLDLRNDRAMPPLDRGWMRVPPYSVVTFTPEGQPVVDKLRTRRDTRRVLVVCSGGLDSTVAATLHTRLGHDVTLLHFTYGCRAEQREVKAVRDVAEALWAQVMLVDMRDLFTNVIGGSPLTNTGTARFAEGEAGAEFAFEWVPARNLILLAVATGIAEAHGFSTLVLGNNIEEAGAYPDNEQEFIRLLNDVMPYAVAADKLVTIDMPVGGLVKHEIVKLGHELQAPIAASWSCYNGGDVHCGNCGPCFMRRQAHKMLGIPDPTVYADESAVQS